MTLPEPEARKRTLEEIRKAPETWHRGKKRAAFILDKVRSGLPKEARRAVRGSLIDLIVDAARNSVGDPVKLRRRCKISWIEWWPPRRPPGTASVFPGRQFQ
ncbi:Hypothetical protein CAP_1292 [Chondromyces apiculatus DSM 436]|uniref:Uncharacterized protein n=1 Tax=Chondromyces apiculatus DSM 436 TaxID=1192034 RepID=A0A017TCP8_9BACT|nr:Hypothetical protein CAP_1292 [Chondromyces apiculatus DSM 436]